MPTSNRPVEPVVGMEYDGLPLGMFQRCRIVAMTAKAVTYQPLAEDALTLTVTRADFMQSWERCRPVLWTVGPSGRRGTRLRDGGIPVTCSADSGGPAKCERCRELLSLYPTRAAALAAGKAHGWERPVARRVVRKG